MGMTLKTPFNVMRHAGWDAAPRDPVTIGAAILGSTATAATTFTIFGTALSVGAWAVGTLVTTALTSFALRKLAPSAGAANRGTLINSRQPAAPHEYVYGQVRKGGIITFLETTGTSNKYLHMIIALAGHEVQSIGDIYVNDEIVTLDASGYVTGTRWKSKIRVLKHLGNQTSWTTNFSNAATNLRDTISAECDLPSTFVGLGIAYLYARIEYDQDVFSGGMPTFTAVVSGKKVYNPVTATTSYSNNAARVLRDYITSSYGLNDPEVDDTYFAAATNDSDDAIPLAGGGTQTRYTIDGVISAESTIGNALADMMEACNGALFFSGGVWKCKVGVYNASVKSLTLDDFRSAITMPTRMPRRENFNRVTGKFIDASSDWIETDFPAITSTAFLAEDGGLENSIDVGLNLVTNAARAQRLAKQKLFRSREQMTISAEFGLAALSVEVGDIIDLTIDRYGWAAKEFEVASWRLVIADGGGLRVALVLRETSSAAFDWNAEESAIISNNTTLLDYNSVPTLGLSVSDALRVYHEKLSNVVSLTTTSSLSGFIDYVQVEFKKSSETPWRDGGYGELGLFEINDIEDGTYDFRVRAVNGFGIKGDWTTRTGYKVEGLSQPPQDVTGFAAEVNGDSINLSWLAVTDLDLSYYIIRHAKETSGATWAGSVTYVEKVARPSTEASVPAKPGTYLIKAVDKTGVQSVNATAVVVTADEVTARATVVTIDEDPTFTGTKDNVVLQDGQIRLGSVLNFDSLSGNIDSLSGQWDALGVSYTVTDGTYYFANIIDRTTPEQGFVTVDMILSRFDTTGGLWDDLAGQIDFLPGLWDDLTGTADFNDTNVTAYVSTTNDNPAGSPTWSEWRKIRAANVYGRALRFKVELHSDAPGISPAISELSATGNYA
jgi:hypothetical protein